MYLEPILIFALFLGPLVFFHELGHFFFARFFGVKVETFSIGFGPKIFKKKYGDTVYALSIIPLGGYVKMFGDDPLNSEEMSEEEKKVAYTHKGKWARFWIVFGGPLANFLFAFVIYLGLSNIGESVPEAKFGIVTKNSVFGKANLKTGDGLRKINNKPVVSFDDLNLLDSQINTITVKREGKLKTVQVDLTSSEFIKEFTSISAPFRAPLLSDGKGGLYYVSTSKDKPSFKESLEEVVNSDSKELFIFKITSDIKKSKRLEDLVFSNNSKTIPKIDDISQLHKMGYFTLDLRIDSVQMKSSADAAELRAGDIITTINDQSMNSFTELKTIVQDNDIITMKIIRDGEVLTKKLEPKVVERDGVKVKAIGIASSIIMMPHNMIEVKAASFGASIISSYNRTQEVIIKTILGFKKLITNEVSLDNIGGPLAIGKVASDSFNISLSMFFRLMAMISVNLGIINLFPIPVLDGGHIVFIFLEMLNGGPLSRKKIMIAQQFGMSLLFILIFFALFNDISRFFL